MENLKAKLKKQGGFTMVELLIVVAIIGVLAAVSIPMFNSALEKARHGVDHANARDAISAAYAEYVGAADSKYFDTERTYQYVVDPVDHDGDLVEGTTGGVTPQCTCTSAIKNEPLGVSIKNDANGKPVIKLTGWKFNTATNKTEAAD